MRKNELLIRKNEPLRIRQKNELHRRKLSNKSKPFVKQQCVKPVVVHEQNNGTGRIVNVNDVCNRDNLEHFLSS